MSKELEYEITNFANLLNKDCVNLMECLKKQDKDNKAILYLGKHFKRVILPYEEYQKMCNRLEAIDNANPSEVLEELEQMREIGNHFWVAEKVNKSYMTIKQYILKAQEPKKYLKWEDLEFKGENFPIKVKVGNTEYLLCFHNIGKDQALTIQNYDQLLCTFYLNSYYDKQFFNDLHLERVEE